MDLNAWMEEYRAAVEAAFGSRVVCLGLQGSQARGEATPESDIDAVLVLDRLAPADLARYREAVCGLPCREKLCGFVGGKEELLGWEPGDLFALYSDTAPLVGDLEFLRPLAGPDAARCCVRNGACAIYHACVHDLLHERSPELLAGLQKAAFFALRAAWYCRTGRIVKQRCELAPLLPPAQRALLEGDPADLDGLGGRLLEWAGRTIRTGEGLDPDAAGRA